MKTITSKKAARLLPLLAADANKYTRGVCELVVGEPEYPGAGVLCAMAATRAGAGYVEVYACDETAAALRVVQPSCVCRPIESFLLRVHRADFRHPRAVVAGCGFAGGDASAASVAAVLGRSEAPVLVDGGGLSALATSECKASLKRRFVEGLPTVVTPHGGEAARIIEALDIPGKADRERNAKSQNVPPAAVDALLIARALGVVCVLKGPDTYIADGNEASADDVLQLTCGTPALAKAGTGDVLAGIIGSLLAQGLAPKDACALGAYVHARAGVLAAADSIELCVTAEDVAKHVPHAFRAVAGAIRP